MRLAIVLVVAGTAFGVGCAPDSTPLAMAARAGDLSAMRALIDAGADVNQPDPNGNRFPDTVAVLRRAAPDVRLGRGLPTRIVRWLARRECAPLVASLQGP
jgi:hypothetical protein